MNKRIFLVAISIIFICSCDIEYKADIYFNDIESIAEKETSQLKTNADIKIEFPTSSQCNEKKAETLDFLSMYFSDIDNPQCVDEGFDSFLKAKSKINLYNCADNNSISDNEMIGLCIEKIEDFGHLFYKASIIINKNKYEVFKSSVGDKFRVSMKPENMHFKFTFENDSNSPVDVIFFNSYVSGKPTPYPDMFTIDRRSQHNVEISSVLSAYLQEEGRGGIFLIKLQKE